MGGVAEFFFAYFLNIYIYKYKCILKYKNTYSKEI